MRGKVELYKVCNEEKTLFEKSDNLILDNAGELIVDILTVNPGLSSVAGAAAILDASNYTVQAITFGKGSTGYKNHAHTIASGFISNINEGSGIVVQHRPNMDTSSYQTSDVDLAIISYPHPHDQRLERNSTQTTTEHLPPSVSLPPDMGHNINAIALSALNGFGTSSVLIGCYPPSAGIKFIKVNKDNVRIASGVYKSRYNGYKAIDSSGFIHMIASGANSGAHGGKNIAYNPKGYGGLIVTASGNGSWKTSCEVVYQTHLSAGDAGAASLYGGIYGMGLWYLDMKSLLAEGKNPPYGFDYLNNKRKYKLFSKKVFSKDITYHADSGGSASPPN